MAMPVVVVHPVSPDRSWECLPTQVEVLWTYRRSAVLKFRLITRYATGRWSRNRHRRREEDHGLCERNHGERKELPCEIA
jgi:hypothetical protein